MILPLPRFNRTFHKTIEDLLEDETRKIKVDIKNGWKIKIDDNNPDETIIKIRRMPV